MIRGFFLFYVTMTHRLIIPFTLHHRWFIIRAHPSLSLKGRHPRHHWPILFCSFTPLTRPSLKSNPSLPRRHSSLVNDRFLYTFTHPHTHTHRLFMHTKNKNKRGEKGAIHKSQKQWPRRHVDVYSPSICWDDLSTERGGHSENRISVKKPV